MPLRQPAFWLILILLFTWTRIHQISVFPSFIDEAQHVNIVENLITISPLSDAGEGRILTPYYLWLFSPQTSGGVTLARIAITLIDVAAFISLVKIAWASAGRLSAFFAAFLLILNPFDIFFGRLALADSLSASLIAIALYCALRALKRQSRLDAILTGLLLFTAIGAKITALPFLSLPMAVLFPGLSLSLHFRIRQSLIIGAVAACLVGLLWVGLSVFNRDLFGLISFHNTGVSEPLFQRIYLHAIMTYERMASYWSAPLTLVAALSLLWNLWRRPYLALTIIVPLLALWLNERQMSRYLPVFSELILLSLAVMFGELARKRRVMGFILVIFTVTWVLTISYPFFRMMQSTESVLLPEFDQREYIASDGSGFGLDQIVSAIEPFNQYQIVGLLANCNSLRYMVLSQDHDIICPRLDPAGRNEEALTDLVSQMERTMTLIIVEEIAYIPQSVDGDLVAVIQDSSGRPTMRLYSLAG
jgi:hypothetical protein